MTFKEGIFKYSTVPESSWVLSVEVEGIAVVILLAVSQTLLESVQVRDVRSVRQVEVVMALKLVMAGHT